MAKKKKRHRRPVAPPVHSAPGMAGHTPHTPVPASPPARPTGAEPPAAPPATTPAVRKAPQRRKTSRALGKKRRRVMPWIVSVVVIAAVAAAIVGSKITANKAADRFDALAATAGCGKVQIVSGLSRDHVDGQRVHYSTSPPAGGDHYSIPLPAGIYSKPLTTRTSNPATNTSIYRAVHSLEHGAVIVWYKDLSKSQISKLKREYQGSLKVIVAPYPGLKDPDQVALTAWGRLDYCKSMSTTVINAFIERYRQANSAPEPFNPI
jgi:Protein of unknown function (DUF3105)